MERVVKSTKIAQTSLIFAESAVENYVENVDSIIFIMGFNTDYVNSIL